ncbi:MAG TPA: response regulator [Actinomycetota bacterium]|jgi:DNA-binding response OmpR family regulator
MNGARAIVLVVDDDPDLQLLLRSTLQTEGYEVRSATGALSAMDRIREDRPQLVLLDLMMPEVDGWAVLEAHAREFADERDAPRFIVVSAKAADEDRARAVGLGADDYVTKPFDPRALAGVIREVLARTREEAEANRRALLARLAARGAGRAGVGPDQGAPAAEAS